MGFAVIGVVAAIIAVVLVLAIRHVRSKDSSASYSGPPWQDVERAFQIVWVYTYHMLPSKAPSITWVTGKRLNCDNGTGWVVDGECVAGETYHDQNSSAVAWVKDEKISDTAFAHELCHHYLDVIGQPDPNHTGPAFAQGGIKDQAILALRAAGL